MLIQVFTDKGLHASYLGKHFPAQIKGEQKVICHQEPSTVPIHLHSTQIDIFFDFRGSVAH